MELEGEDGSKIKLEPDSDNNTVFGRGSGFSTKDRTVSRRHLFFTTNNNQTEPTSGGVSFEVLGKNPIWVRSKSNNRGGGETGIRVFRRLERGDMEAGDCFCVCGQNPVWFTVKRNEKNELGLDVCVDVSDIDPVKEFGFLLIGHEFDQYPKQRIRDARDWDWFLEEPRKNGDDDEDEDEKVKRRVWRKRKKAKGDEDEDDDDWTDDVNEDEEQTAKLRKVRTHYYSTRSKDGRKSHKDVKHNQSSVQRSLYGMEENEEGENEDDETLGGFIVDNDEVELEDKSDMDEDKDYDDDDDDD